MVSGQEQLGTLEPVERVWACRADEVTVAVSVEPGGVLLDPPGGGGDG